MSNEYTADAGTSPCDVRFRVLQSVGVFGLIRSAPAASECEPGSERPTVLTWAVALLPRSSGMTNSVEATVLSSCLVFAEALHHLWESAHPDLRCRVGAPEDVPGFATAPPGNVLLLHPQSPDELQRLLPELHRHAPALPVVVFGDLLLAGAFVMGLPAQHAAIVAANATPAELLARLRDLAEGQVIYPVETLVDYLHRGRMARGEPPPPELTRRELEVSCALAYGLVEEKLVEVLGMEYSTAKFHIHRLLVKLGLSSREQLIEYFQRALVPAVPPGTPLQPSSPARKRGLEG